MFAETINRRWTDNTITKRTNSNQQNTTQKTKGSTNIIINRA